MLVHGPFTCDQPEVTAFLLDPENAVSHSLRHLNFAHQAAEEMHNGYRFSIRTGLINELPTGVGEKLRNLTRMRSHADQGVLAVGIRQASGQWTISFPSEFTLNSSTYSFQEAFDEVGVSLTARLSDGQPGLPMFFYLWLVSRV